MIYSETLLFQLEFAVDVEYMEEAILSENDPKDDEMFIYVQITMKILCYAETGYQKNKITLKDYQIL